ncbi:MAG: phosphoglycerate dehydrogenase, partial [Oscillospiraceae bacterium]|nr:phosphoglycerate dehydrogenase [Oscillospiraceae bacterium]
LGVIGLGAIGVLVANAAASLGMEVYGYDPFLSVDGAWKLSRKIRHCVNLADLYAQCDYLTLHIPATPDTTGMLNKAAFDQMKHGVRILNFARGELVVNADILAAVKSGKVAAFYSDFAAEELLGVEGVTVTPHLGASTPESEENCAVMAAEELQDYLLNGNIRNSVNLPNVCIPRSGCARICVIHKNSPGVIGRLSSAAGDAGLNIDNMVNKSKKDYAYTMLDVETAPSQDVIDKLSAIEGVVRVRVL